MIPRALTYQQYINGIYIKSLNIHNEVQIIRNTNDLKRLNFLKKRFEKVRVLMPSKYDPNYEGKIELHFDFDKDLDYSVMYKDRRGIVQYGVDNENGTKGFIKAVHDCCDEYLKIINTLELDLTENTSLKEFPEFGSWENLDNPNGFKLKKGILGCVVLSFDRIKKETSFTYEELYYKLSLILQKENGEPYSERAIKNARIEKNKRKIPSECSQIFKISVADSVTFIRYLLENIQ